MKKDNFLANGKSLNQFYIKKSIQLIEEMQSYDKFDLDDLFFGNPPKKEDFRIALLNILENIKQLEKIPMDQRTYFYD